MVPSFMTRNKANRSIVANLNAVKQISFSGSSVSSCTPGQSSDSKERRPNTNITFDAGANLLLHRLRLPQKSLVHRQPPNPALSISHVIAIRLGVRFHALKQVIAVVSDVAPLGLDVRVRVDAHEAARRGGEVFERRIGASLAYEQMNDYESLEGNGPGGVAQAKLQRAKDVAYCGFASSCSFEKRLDIFGLWRRKLQGEYALES